jgi:hypothetical protein
VQKDKPSDPASSSASTTGAAIVNDELDTLFARLATAPNRAKSIVADLLRQGKIGAHDVARLEEELNNAYSLIHEKGVPFSGLRLVQANEEGEEGRKIKVDMTDEAIRYLCQQSDETEEPNAVVAPHQNGHTTSMRSLDGLPVSHIQF